MKMMTWAVQGMYRLILAYLASVVLSGLAFAAFEHKSVVDSLWWAVVTATTTGYGDISPQTVPGRAIAIFLMHFAPFFVMPLVTAQMASKLIVDSDAFTHAEQEEIKTLLKEIKERLDDRA